MADASNGLIAALARAQANFGTITKAHENPHYKSKYADLADVLAVVRPALNAEGIWLTQPLGTDMDGRVRLFTRLEGHGEVREASLPVHLDNMTPQQLLSTLTYYRRGMLAALLGVAAEDDDDGYAAQTAPARPQQATSAAPPDDWQTRPLATMTFTELRGVAEKVGHAFSGGSKSELIRQLEPLVRAASGDEPWEPIEKDVDNPQVTAPRAPRATKEADQGERDKPAGHDRAQPPLPPVAITQPDKPLVAMTMRELLDFARDNSVTVSGSKSDIVRTLEPLVRAASGDEPWPVEGEGGVTAEPPTSVGMGAAPSRPEPDAIPFNPKIAEPVVALPNESGSARKIRDSIRRGGE